MPNRLPSDLARSTSTEQVIVGEHLADLRGRVRFLTWVSGLCWTLIVFLGGLLITGTLDWLVHFDDSGTRLFFGLALAGGAGWMCWRQLIAPLRQQLTGSFLAARVEHRFPGLRNRVISAVEFLEHRLDARVGSTELQKAVVGQAIKDLDRIEPSDVVESKSVRNVTIAGLFVCAIAATVLLLHPAEAATSVQRLMFPFSKVPWPRTVELQLVRADLSPVIQAPDEPIMIARGDTLELYVRNKRGQLPDRVWFEYRIGDGQIVRDSLRQTTLRDEKGQSYETAVISWLAVRGTMEFRASGGDDNVMSFHRVEVVPPPEIESLQVTVRPPAYSQRPVETLPPGVGHVQGLLGTKVEVVATSDKPLHSAKLRVGERPVERLEIHEDEHRFTAIFEIKDTLASNYWFELTDKQGFTDREAVRYELRGIADGVPDVSIESPVADLMLTADAELPVKILAKDDLGLTEVRITYQVGDSEKLATIPLFSKTETADGSTQNSGPLPLGPQWNESDYLWKMADLHPEPGTRIVFRGEATDDYDLGPAHVGKSVPRTITIVTRDEKQKELAGRVGDLLDDLRQVTQLQQRARQETQELQTQLEKVGELRSQDLDQLLRAELDQRQTASRLTQPADGVESQAKTLLEELRANYLNDAGTEQRLERITNELGRLQRDELPEAERALTRAQKLAERTSPENGESSSNDEQSPKSAGEQSQGDRKSSKTPPKSSPAKSSNPDTKSTDPKSAESEKSSEPKSGENAADPSAKSKSGDEKESSDSNEPGKGERPDSSQDKQSATPSEKLSPSPVDKALDQALSDALSQQTRSLETLQELQDSLAEWRDRRDVSQDLQSVIQEQEAVQKDASELAQKTMSKSAAELSKQDKAELKKLASRQQKIADQLDKFSKQLDRTADSLQKNDPDTAENLSEASRQLDHQETGSKLQEAAENIGENKMGAAAEAQQKALEELHDVERMMKRQGNEDTEQFLKQTQEAQQEFHQMRQEQQDLADQAHDLAKQPDSPDKQEQLKELQEKQEELTERMAKAERKLERLRLRGAADASHRARKRLTEMMKNMQEADDADEMQEAMEEALDDLEQVERELVLEKRIAQERLAFEQLEKIEDELKALRARQEAVIAETIRLDEAKGERDSLTRGQLKTLKELTETERSLQHSAEGMQHQMASAEVFSLVLKRMARSLNLAADRMDDRETAAPTQALQRDAIRKIDSLLAVLKQEQKKQEKPEQPAEKPEQLGDEPQEQEEKPEEAQPPGNMVTQIAQLKLLKSLQEEYLERTELLDKFRDKDGKLPESMEAEKNELAREQVELADFARNLIAKLVQQQPERKDNEHKDKEGDKPDSQDETRDKGAGKTNAED